MPEDPRTAFDSRTRHLATSLFFTPAGRNGPLPASARVTPSMFLGTPPFILSTPVTTVEDAVTVIRAGGTVALPPGGDGLAVQVLQSFGLCEHRAASRLWFTRTRSFGPHCDCPDPARS